MLHTRTGALGSSAAARIPPPQWPSVASHAKIPFLIAGDFERGTAIGWKTARRFPMPWP